MLTTKKWIDTTDAIGLQSRQGKIGGTYAHPEIACVFRAWLRPEFQSIHIDPVVFSCTPVRPFNTAFTRQMNTVRNLYGTQLTMPKLLAADIQKILRPVLDYYPVKSKS